MAVMNPARMPAESSPIGKTCPFCWEIKDKGQPCEGFVRKQTIGNPTFARFCQRKHYGIKPGCHWIIDHNPADCRRKLHHVCHCPRMDKGRGFALDVRIKRLVEQAHGHISK